MQLQLDGSNKNWKNDNMLHPYMWRGIAPDCQIPKMEWIKQFGKNTYCALWQRWPGCNDVHNLPDGYDLYIVSFHLEPVDVPWLWKQSKIDAPIIVLSDNTLYNCPLPDNVKPYVFYWWHEQLALINKWFPKKIDKNITHQFSAICNRISQSKLLVTTALLESDSKCMIKLSKWQGTSYNHKTGNKKLDNLFDIFYNKWYGNEIKLEDTGKGFHNEQRYTSNPWTDVYQRCALHFTNESFHYSLQHDELGVYVYPGPFITEKTLKCLAGATGFIPVGQFETYKALQDVGFKFDYEFDTSFDNDAGNITRLESIVNLVEQLSTWTKDDLFAATEQSSKYNQEYVSSQDFYKFCAIHNNKTIENLCTKFQ